MQGDGTITVTSANSTLEFISSYFPVEADQDNSPFADTSGTPAAPCNNKITFNINDESAVLDIQDSCYDVCLGTTDSSAVPFILTAVGKPNNYYKMTAFVNGTEYFVTPSEITTDDNGIFGGEVNFAKRLSPNMTGSIRLRATELLYPTNFAEDTVSICCQGTTTTTDPCRQLYPYPNLTMEDRCYQSTEQGSVIGILQFSGEGRWEEYTLEMTAQSVPLDFNRENRLITFGGGNDIPVDEQPVKFTIEIKDPCGEIYEEHYTVFPCDGPDEIVWLYVPCEPDQAYTYEDL